MDTSLAFCLLVSRLRGVPDMVNALDKARAVILVNDAREVLIRSIRNAKATGVSETELMQILNINQYSLTKFLED